MSSDRDKYRNPPPPVGYVQKEEPDIVMKKAPYEDSIIYILYKKLLDEKLYDIENFSQYDDFIINPSSDDEIVEVPFVPVPKVVDMVDITEDDQTEEDKKPTIDPPISVKKERESQEPPKVKEDVVQITMTAIEKERESPEPPKVKEDVVQITTTAIEKQMPQKMKHKKKKRHSERRSKKKEKQKRSSSYSSDDSNKDSYSSNKKKTHRKKSSSRSSSSSRSRSKSKNRKIHSSYSEDEIYYKKEYRRSSRRTHDTDFDDTDDSNYYQDRRLSRSPTGHRQTAAKLKREDRNQEPSLLHGDYRCHVCNVPANNLLTYQSHLKGKRHKKALENQQKEAQREATMAKIPLQNQVAPIPIVPKILIPSQPSASKYTQPPLGYIREKLDTPSVIQDFLDKNSKFPCPGLHKVTEIRGPTETVYYCAICDCNCSYNSIIQHLGGFKHQLNSLKYYRNDLFEKWSYKPKYQIQEKVLQILFEEQKKNGKGVVQVEKDVKDRDSASVETQLTSLNIRDQPSTSYQSQDPEFYENYMYNSLPDPTKSGYYCKLCDSHSNSESMWNAHVIGKRHIANVKKNPGLAPSKSKYIRAERDVQPMLFKIIEEENECNSPIVGLNQIREIRKPDINGILFNCFLCGACVNAMDIVSHLVSAKHREKYLISIKHPEMETLKCIQVSESYRSSILEEICGKVQEEEGMGMPDVFYAKKQFNLF